jgi:hypothetical protein
MEGFTRIKLFKILDNQEVFVAEGYVQNERLPLQVGEHMLLLKTNNQNKFIQTSKINKVDGTTFKTNNSTYRYYPSN